MSSENNENSESLQRFNVDGIPLITSIAHRASLMTEIVLKMIRVVGLDLSRVHNDSTTVKAYSKIPGRTKTGLKLAHGKSKDYRPDLKQLVFSLSVLKNN